jgi:PTS system N-acetylgalactosamine-specific IIA component
MTTSDGAAGSRRAILAGHAGFAEGAISAVAQIAGMGDSLVAVSNTGLTLEALEGILRARLRETGATIIFTDLPAGSCTLAARRIARTDPGLTVITGVGLPTLLSWACGGDLTAATERGREALAQVEGPRDP